MKDDDSIENFILTGYNDKTLISSSQINCPICNFSCYAVTDLPHYPLTELYEPWEETFSPKGFLDQELRYCQPCNHLFLKNVVDQNFIYTNYKTKSSFSQGAIECLDSFRLFIERNIQIKNFKNIIDIGGNDSSFLINYSDSNKRLVNIDPNATGPSNIEQIHTFFENFSLIDFKDVRNKMIVSSHTIEHIKNPKRFIEEISKVVGISDVVFLQFPSLESLTTHLRFDQVCHQHLNYFSQTSIARLLADFGLSIQAYEFDENHFGTLRIFARMESKKDEKTESNMHMGHIRDQYNKYTAYCKSLNSAIEDVFVGGHGFGAGLMVPTLAYHLPIVNKLGLIFDDDKSKHNTRFINVKPKVIGFDTYNYKGSPVLITSVSTKKAARVIWKKLTEANAKYIVMPIIFT